MPEWEYKGWRFWTRHGTINTHDAHRPDMYFKENTLVCEYTATHTRLVFSAEEAVAAVDHAHPVAIQVQHASSWKSTRQDTLASAVGTATYDWTWTSLYRGSVHTALTADFHTDPRWPGIDYARLKQREPILFQDHVVLYEDELHDSGVSQCDVRMVSLFLFLLGPYWMAVFVCRE